MAETVFPVLFGNTESSPDWLVKISETYFNGNTEGYFLLVCCLAMPLVILMRSIGSIGNGYFMTYSGIHVVQSIQIDMFKKVQALPLAFLQKYKTGEMNAAVMGYPGRIKDIVVNTSNELIKEPLTLISAVGFLIYKSFTSDSFFMAVVGVSTIPIIILIIKRVGNYLAQRSVQLVKLGEKLSSWVIESFQSPVEIRAYNMQEKQIENFTSSLREIFRINMKTTRFSLAMSPSIEVISGLGLAISLYMGVKSGMAEGEFLALVVALYMAYSPVKKIGAIQNKIKTLQAPLDRLETIFFAEETIQAPKNPKSLPYPLKGNIKFENVSFEYIKNKQVLSNVSTIINSNNYIGLVGESGAGKSTFANLILRLYDPTRGKIFIDGIDLREVDPKELREHISYVPQTPLLFNDTIINNIRIGKPSATDEEVIEASKHAQAHDFIEATTNGYNTEISERGNSLSGGQKQRISIARAFLKDAPILILDEATSSLDNKADVKIKKAIESLSQGRTTIVIAHRLSTLDKYARRILFEKGEIIYEGTHEVLMRECDKYNKLVNKNALS